MGTFASWLRGRKAVASGTALVVLAGIPVSFALLHHGFPVTDVDLTSQNVWVTNGQELLGGRLDHQIGELDAKVNGASSHLDVLQDGGATLLTDTSLGTVQKIDPAFVSLTDKITVPVGAQLAYGKDTLAILSQTGTLWVVDASDRLQFDQSTTSPVAKLGPNAQVVVSKSGKVFAVSPSRKKLYAIDHPGATATSSAYGGLADYQLSAVGDHPVALDTETNSLIWADGSRMKLDQKALRIQQAGPDNGYVLVATGKSLLEVPLGGGDQTDISAHIPTAVKTRADVSAPVFLNGCSYGAWSGAQKYLYACDGKKAIARDIGQPTTGNDLEFRVNHGVIALNNLQNGNAWVVSSNMRLVNNWAQVNPNEVTKTGQTGKEKPVRQSFADMLANRTAINHPPVAVDDSFGARPGRTTILPVLSNDTDPDGDVLTVTKISAVPAAEGKVDVIEGGRSLQLTPAQGTIATVSFRYTITDGRGAYASAQVNVTVRPLTLNVAPVAVRTSTTSVEVGQSITYNVLDDWIDPDGDDIYLVGASATTADAVQFSPGGEVTFTSKTGQTGSKKVVFTVSDGRKTATGSLMVNVKPSGSMNPVAVPDFQTAFIGDKVVIHPLDNDQSPSGSPLSLVGAKLDGSGNATVTVDQDKSAITFTGNTVGPFYLEYTLAAGAKATQGLILVDVTAPPGAERAPIAVKDVTYVRPGEPSTVNVLDNDVSPSGRVLVVQSVDAGPDASALNIEVLANAVVRITSAGVLAQQVQLTYTVSDGFKTSTAGITVVPIPPLVNHQPPVAQDDTATVRAGDVVSVHVLANDSSPDNEPFTLDPKLQSVAHQGAGAIAFVSGDLVRYQAPSKPGTYSVVYGISDKFHQKASATVTFVVTAPNKAHDHAPQPLNLTARAFAGGQVGVVVVVPLDGIDPDGDSVSLTGIGSAPSLGRITAVGSTSFTYQAYPDSVGTDTFTYNVEDTYGKTAVGTVRIGIIKRPSTVKPPTAVDDRVEIKPGKVASVPVLQNDSDPNGYVISLMPKLPEVQAPLKAKVSSGNVLVTAPKKEGAFVVRYEITNGHGGQATAFIQVLVTKNATPQYPVAVDHDIDIQSLTGRKTVTVDVYAGAHNPSGLVGDLTVGLEGPHAKSAQVGPNGKVTVTPGQHRMAITYSLTDRQTNLAGKAFIIVPPKPGSADASTAPPRIKPGLAKQIVAMNGTKTWKLSQIIDVPSGRPTKLTGRSGASATNSDKPPYVNAQTLTFTGSKDYRGPAAITFRVDDGRDSGTTKDRITLLTLPIAVGNPDQTDVPPTFTPPNVTLQAGEKPLTIDLRNSSYHPNPKVLAQLGYRNLRGATASVAASLSGSKLTMSAPLGVQPGTTARLTFTVTYKNFSVPGSVNVRVVSSTRPVAQQKNAPQQLQLKRNTSGGKTLQNAVGTAYWINPFPDNPLVILSAKAVSAPAGVSVSHTASSITMTAGTAAATGSVNITYRVQDATKDPQRVQTGQLTVTIHDVPDAPPAPSKVNATDKRATMTLTAPKSDNGKPINDYEVYWTGGGTGTKTSAGGFTATGLTNGKAYTFKVRARNADGWSAWSPWSAKVTPYGTPGAPTGVQLTRSGQYAPATLTLKWAAPGVTGGGAVEYSYRFDNAGSWSGWSGWTSATSTTKSVGVGTYSFQVRARNTHSKNTGSTATSNQVQINKKPPPAKTVDLQRGAYTTGPGCSHGCFYYHVTAKNFAANTSYQIQYFCNGGGAMRTDSYTTDGSGNIVIDTGSTLWRTYCGYPTASVTFGGVSSGNVNFQP